MVIVQPVSSDQFLDIRLRKGDMISQWRKGGSMYDCKTFGLDNWKDGLAIS